MAELVTARASEQAAFHVRDTLAGCSGLCRQLLCRMALLDDGCGPETLSRLLGISTVALIPVLEEAYATGLLHDQGGVPVFVSLLARCLVAETVPRAVRTALRRERAALGGPTSSPPPSTAPDGCTTPWRTKRTTAVHRRWRTNSAATSASSAAASPACGRRWRSSAGRPEPTWC